MTPLSQAAETVLRNTCKAMVEEDQKTRKRPYMAWELHALAKMYSEEKISLEEMAARLKRPVQSINEMLRMLEIARRRPVMSGWRVEFERRNAKIIEAVLLGDSHDAIARRWGLEKRRVYEILVEYRRRVGMQRALWRRRFFGKAVRF